MDEAYKRGFRVQQGGKEGGRVPRHIWSSAVLPCKSRERVLFRIVRSRDSTAWPSWLQSAKGTALASFAAHLIRDQAAVLAALETPWSNGQVEGQVHRLKLVKRQMYGRASFDLLRLRVLNRA
jgi:transposase